MTHAERIDSMLQRTQPRGDNNWGARHCAAWREPQPVEAGIVGLIQAAATYADSHQRRFESGVGEDGFLGEPWADILRSVRTLLNGEIGRLDGGTVDSLIGDMLKAEGFEE